MKSVCCVRFVNNASKTANCSVCESRTVVCDTATPARVTSRTGQHQAPRRKGNPRRVPAAVYTTGAVYPTSGAAVFSPGRSGLVSTATGTSSQLAKSAARGIADMSAYALAGRPQDVTLEPNSAETNT
mmetsp:Transcript_6356/g.11688  ORF Transcript_6356/g.11688 Transcript_6356/m.11688 type:complete len:128 (+) Transcript_6356:475-858(+)